MADLLLNIHIAAFPLAYTVMLISGLRLYKNTALKSAAAIALGMGVLLLSQVILFGAYKIWPVIYEHNTGIEPAPFRDSMFWLSTGLNIVGLLISSVGFAAFSWVGNVAGRTTNK